MTNHPEVERERGPQLGFDPIFTDDQLRLVVKSLSITYDALSSKLNRATGRIYDETVKEFELCSEALTEARASQTNRLRPVS